MLDSDGYPSPRLSVLSQLVTHTGSPAAHARFAEVPPAGLLGVMLFLTTDLGACLPSLQLQNSLNLIHPASKVLPGQFVLGRPPICPTVPEACQGRHFKFAFFIMTLKMLFFLFFLNCLLLSPSLSLYIYISLYLSILYTCLDFSFSLYIYTYMYMYIYIYLSLSLSSCLPFSLCMCLMQQHCSLQLLNTAMLNGTFSWCQVVAPQSLQTRPRLGLAVLANTHQHAHAFLFTACVLHC